MGKLITLVAVFAAGYLWGDQALTLAVDAWEYLAEGSRIKLEEYR